MTLRRRGLPTVLMAAVALGGLAACEAGGPDRASDIQNLHAISDDIAAVTMTHSPTSRAHDPNMPTLFPRSYSTSYTPERP